MDIQLRTEKPSDYDETENVTREAFWNHYSPGCNEHYLLHVMRDCPDFIPELDIVAVYEGKIIGHVASIKSSIIGDDGKDHEVLCLGPISVLPEYQRQGIGGQLIEHTKNIARAMGFRAILLYGDPDVYSRKGFVPAETFGLRTADDKYMPVMQVCVLYEHALAGITGRYVEHEIYHVDEEAGAEFDKKFPPKELVAGTPSQKRFELLSTHITEPEPYRG